MVKNAYSYIKQNIRKNLKEKLIAWRKQNSIVKINKPTDIGRARKLGYKDKKGYVVCRVKIRRGGHKRTRPRKGRKTKNLTIRKNLKMNYRWISESRAQRKFTNLEVLNSYQIGKDGQHYFYEIIMIDSSKPEILNSEKIKWIATKKNKNRVFRGLTSAGKKARGLRKHNKRKVKDKRKIRKIKKKS
tara:strand:- start:2468 stop:3028 length:561 start_codon:yes stop_codon:yes gene_type:complete